MFTDKILYNSMFDRGKFVCYSPLSLGKSKVITASPFKNKQIKIGTIVAITFHDDGTIIFKAKFNMENEDPIYYEFSEEDLNKDVFLYTEIDTNKTENSNVVVR